MNKELIKKYQTEFDHWLNGGELLTSIDKINWEDVTDNNSWSNIDRVYIINDEYVEFRKALAEGKIIQQQDYYSKEWIDMKTDKFHGASDTQYEGVYRIKPDELKFKVGDWVRDLRNNNVFQINSVNFNLNLSITNGVYIHWQPKSGEWCWFTHDIGVKNVGCLKEFKEISADTSYRDCYGNKWRYCEPFVNSKPSWFKE